MGSLFESEKKLKKFIQYFPTIAFGASRIIDRLFAKKALDKYEKIPNGVAQPSKALSVTPGNLNALANTGYVSYGGGGGGWNGCSTPSLIGVPVFTSGTVTSVTITNSGSGYISAPIVTFSGGGGGTSTVKPIAFPEIYCDDY